MDLATRNRIGSTTVEVGPLGLGTVPIGGLYEPVTDDDAFELVRRAHELGVRLFDTAPQYGSGLAETRLGQVLPEFDRSSMVVATKVGRLLRPITFAAKTRRVLVESLKSGDVKRIGGDAVKITRRLARGRSGVEVQMGYPFDQGQAAMESYYDFSYDGVMRSFEESLKRLRLDRVDLLYIHDPDHHSRPGAPRRVQGARQAAKRQGRRRDRRRHEPDRDAGPVRQGGGVRRLPRRRPLHAPRPEALEELLPECERRGISVIVGGVYNSGILANPTPGATFNYTTAPRE